MHQYQLILLDDRRIRMWTTCSVLPHTKHISFTDRVRTHSSATGSRSHVWRS